MYHVIFVGVVLFLHKLHKRFVSKLWKDVSVVVVTHYQIGAQIQTLSAEVSASATICVVEASSQPANQPSLSLIVFM